MSAFETVRGGAELSEPTVQAVDYKSKGRSRMSNGAALLSGVDGRNTWARRLRDLIDLHVSDLGGADAISAAEKSIIRRAATLTVELERLEARFALAGEADADDLDLYQRCASNLRRLLEAVGLQRRSRDVTPTLAQYLAGKAREKAVDSISAPAATIEAEPSKTHQRASGESDEGGMA